MFDPEIRHRAIVHYKYFLPSLRRVGKMYGVSKSTLQRWVTSARCIPRRPKRRRKRMVDPLVDVSLSDALQANPFLTLAELAQHLKKTAGIQKSPRTVCRYLKQLRFSRKKAYRTIRHREHAANVTKFCQSYPVTSDGVICIDEAGFHVGDSGRRGYSKRGSRLNIPDSRRLVPSVG